MKKIKRRQSGKTRAPQKPSLTCQQPEHLQKAENIYRKILREQPNNIKAYIELSFLLRTNGRIDEAILYYRKALALNPNQADVYSDLGSALQAKGQIDDAITCYQKALEVNPNHAIAQYNLGSAFHAKGQLEKAITCYQKAIQSNPNALAYNNLGSAFVQKEQLDEAVASYQKAVHISPDYSHAYYNLGVALKQQNRTDEATAAFDMVLRLEPNNMEAHLARCISQLPILYPDQSSIEIYRNRYYNKLIDLMKLLASENVHQRKAAAAIGTQQPFFLAYQGLNDRELQRLYGNLVCGIMSSRYPQFSRRPSMPALVPGERLRIGIVSGYFCYHSNWKIPIKGWIENLDRKRFSLYGYYTGKKKDAETAAARKCCARFVEDVSSFEELCMNIRGDDLHALIFPEIGMDVMTVKLASVWLAPVQCTSWGHPDTSGFPTIDYYLSSDLMEPPDADDHYTERLVRLPHLSVYYEPLKPPDAGVTRDFFGLKPHSVLYLCCQSLFKYLPQYDDIYPRIAREVGDCQFLFIANNSSITAQFRKRLDEAFKRNSLQISDYVVFLPRLEPAHYHGVNALSDVYLDGIGWSGCNSTFEAIACNLPVVTFPGNLMRGRHSSAILSMMGTTDTVAGSIDEYVMLAVRLGKDLEWRKHISDKIAVNKHRSYKDRDCIAALEDFLEKAVREKLKSS